MHKIVLNLFFFENNQILQNSLYIYYCKDKLQGRSEIMLKLKLSLLNSLTKLYILIVEKHCTFCEINLSKILKMKIFSEVHSI